MPWTMVGNLTPPSGSGAEIYARPPDWLPLPAVDVGDNKFVGLHAVWPDAGANFAALSASGNYTVDWGDGSAVENVASGVQANHQYTYASVPSGSASTRGYRQVVVTVAPQAGQTFTGLNLGRKHSQANLPNNYCTGWLDVRLAGASVSGLQLGMDTGSTATVLPMVLEQFEYVGPSQVTNIGYFFGGCNALQSLKGSQWTAGVTSAASWLFNAASLRIVSDMNFSSLANAQSMFLNNKIIQRVANLNLAVSSAGNRMFEGCTSLVEISNIDLPAATNIQNIASGCTALRSAETISAPQATNCNNVFNGCNSLQKVSGLITPKGTDFNNAFFGCAALRTVGLFDTSQGTIFYSMFSGCKSLQQVPVFDTSKGNSFSSMFSGCSSLAAVPALQVGQATDLSNFVNFCPSLAYLGIVGAKQDLSVAGCRLSTSALDALYTNLGGPVTAKTVTVTGNYGTTADNPTIATTKGWTVTGS